MTETEKTNELTETVVAAIREKRGHKIVKMDLRALTNAVCDIFVLCNAESDRQSQAIADHVAEKVSNEHAQKAYHVQGMETGNWVILDYIDVVVHVFQPEYRTRYKLEDVWGDATIENLPEED